MSRFRIIDGVAPGHIRVPLGEISTSQQGVSSVGSPILNEAMAVKYKGYTPTKPPPAIENAFKFWRIQAAGPVWWTNAEWYVGELKMYDDSGADVTSQATPACFPNSTVAARLKDNDSYYSGTVINLSPYNADSPAWVQFEFATAKKIRRYWLKSWESQNNTYVIAKHAVYASNDGVVWTKIAEKAADTTGWTTGGTLGLVIDMTFTPGDKWPAEKLAITAFDASGSYRSYDINGTYPASAALDKSPSNQWIGFAGGGTIPTWFKLDLGSAKNVSRYRLSRGNQGPMYNAGKWKLSYSDTGMSGPWTVADDKTATVNTSAVKDVSAAFGTHRYWQFDFTASENGNIVDGLGIGEIEIYGS